MAAPLTNQELAAVGKRLAAMESEAADLCSRFAALEAALRSSSVCYLLVELKVDSPTRVRQRVVLMGDTLIPDINQKNLQHLTRPATAAPSRRRCPTPPSARQG